MICRLALVSAVTLLGFFLLNCEKNFTNTSSYTSLLTIQTDKSQYIIDSTGHGILISAKFKNNYSERLYLEYETHANIEEWNNDFLLNVVPVPFSPSLRPPWIESGDSVWIEYSSITFLRLKDQLNFSHSYKYRFVYQIYKDENRNILLDPDDLITNKFELSLQNGNVQ